VKKRIENHLNAAVSKLIPENMWQKVEASIVRDKERTILMTKKQASLPRRPLRRYAGLLVAACLLLAVGIVGGRTLFGDNSSPAVATVINLDVNPSVSLSVDADDRVILVEAVNADAEAILDGMDLRNIELKVAINAIIGSMAKQGLLEDGNILVSVYNEDAAKAQAVRNLVVSDISNSLKSNKVKAKVMNQTVTDILDAKAFAAEHSISCGKAIFVLNLAAKDPSLSAKELATMSIRDIAKMIKAKRLDIRDMVDYEADDDLFEDLSDQINSDLLSQTTLSVADAKAKALAHANVSDDDAAFIRVEAEIDDGRLIYDIEFRANDTEYECEIDAVSGEVLSHEIDSDKLPVVTDGDRLSTEEARDKALAHAGVASNNIRFLHINFDVDDGVPLYEITFIKGNTRYEYDIHALTGEILDYEAETDSSHNKVPSQSEEITSAPDVTEPPVFLTIEELKATVLSHLGLSSSEAIFEEIEPDHHKGYDVFEVELIADGREYELTVHATTGEILKSKSKPLD